jgi:hypothetical protein
VGETVRRFAVKGSDSPALCQLRERLAEWTELDAQRLELARRSVELPSGLLDSDDALAAISRGAQGKNLWAPITLGKGAAKALVNAIRLDGASVRDGDVEGWRHVAVYISNIRRLRQITGRWHSFIAAIGAPRSDNLREQVESARRALFSAETLKDHSALLASLTSNTVAVDRYRDPDGAMVDLIETLSRMGIEPVLNGEPDANGRYTEHRIIGATTDIERVTRSYSQNGRNHQTTEPRTNGDAHSKNIADESVPMCAGRQIVKREQLNGAFFVQFDDGSIEITTANRTLHFSSLQELLSSTSKSPSQAD